MTTTELPAATPAPAKAGVPFGPEVFAMDYAAEAARMDKVLRESLRHSSTNAASCWA